MEQIHVHDLQTGDRFFEDCFPATIYTAIGLDDGDMLAVDAAGERSRWGCTVAAYAPVIIRVSRGEEELDG